MASGLQISVQVKQDEENGEYVAEEKSFELLASANSIEEAIAEITPMIEKRLKTVSASPRTVQAKLESVTAKAVFSIEFVKNKTLDTFSNPSEDETND